jgi:2-oxoisovalerate dehydrogenase E1 component beta subunit
MQALYRSVVEDVPSGDYEKPLGKAEIVRGGKDVTIAGFGAQIRVIERASNEAMSKFGISCEIIDLRTLLPWDIECVVQSVQKTGKFIISHEAPITCGLGAEISATVQEKCFLNLEAPIKRVCGYDIPFPLVFEKYYLPDELKLLNAICETVEFAKD